jgi:hypothetical protein
MLPSVDPRDDPRDVTDPNNRFAKFLILIKLALIGLATYGCLL